MHALCFSCGCKKSGALKLCNQCHSIPSTRDDQVLSLCLSLQCVTEQTLNRCRQYFRKKNKPPKFKEKIVRMAIQFLDEQLGNSNSQSLEFSSSMFNFDDMREYDSQPLTLTKTITVHVIGKGPKQETFDANATLGKTKGTYHKAQWVVGQDISEQEYENHKCPTGDMFVWYRWINNQWSWTPVSSAKFEQLRLLEFGR